MKPMDWVIIALTTAFTLYVVIKSIRDKKKGKTGCGHDCASCASCSMQGNCPSKPSDKENN